MSPAMAARTSLVCCLILGASAGRADVLRPASGGVPSPLLPVPGGAGGAPASGSLAGPAAPIDGSPPSEAPPDPTAPHAATTTAPRVAVRRPVAVIDLTDDPAVRDLANKLLDILASHTELAPPAISDGAALVDKPPPDD